MEGGDAVGAMGPDDRQVGHADLAFSALLDKAHPLYAPIIAREASPHLVKEATIDLEDDFQMPRKQHLEPPQWPLLQRFGQERVVRVSQRPSSEAPGVIPAKMRLVEQDPHQFWNGHAWVGIVQLNGNL